MILTVAMDHDTSEYRVACVKNRFAKNSASGSDYVVLHADAARMTLYNDRQNSAITDYWRQVS